MHGRLRADNRAGYAAGGFKMKKTTKCMSLKEMIEAWKNGGVSKGFMNSLICNLLCEIENLEK